jgi:hypothetical protein
MRGHFVHPFDDDLFISGNGTAGLEIVEDLPDVDAVIAPLGGGGLLAGIGAALRELRPDAKLYAAEPETAAPLALSFQTGHASRFEAWTPSFVDGAGGKSVPGDVAPDADLRRRFDRDPTRGRRAGDAHRRRPGPRRHGRSRRVRRRRRPVSTLHRPRPQKSRRRRVWWQHRSVALLRIDTRLRALST